MGILDVFKNLAPTHAAELSTLGLHDGGLHLVEARRGRGKSYGMTVAGFNWLVGRLPAILEGSAPHAKVYTNSRLDLHRFALELCIRGHMYSLEHALDVVHERVIYMTGWDTIFTAYDSFIEGDEWNRSVNAYDQSKEVQKCMLVIHDWLQQTRKNSLTLLFAVQYLDWLKPQMKMLMDRIWRARVVYEKPKRLKKPKMFWWYGSDPFANGVASEIVRRADWKIKVPFDIRLARIYDTKQAIETLPNATNYSNFAEISDFMYAHGMKPKAYMNLRRDLTLKELDQIFGDINAQLEERHGPPGALVLPPPLGGGGAGARGGLLDRHGHPLELL